MCVCARAYLQGLRARIPWGQTQFQKLLSSWQTAAGREDVELEELRYRWMLYKSKLKDAECSKAELRLKVLRLFFPADHSCLVQCENIEVVNAMIIAVRPQGGALVAGTH